MEALKKRCLLLYNLKRIKEALRDAEKLCEVSPQESSNQNNRAFLLFQLEQYEDAETSWQKAVELKDVESLAFAGYAVVLEQLHRPIEAAKQYRKAIDIDIRWENDLEVIARECLWTEEMIELAKGIIKRL